MFIRLGPDTPARDRQEGLLEQLQQSVRHIRAAEDLAEHARKRRNQLVAEALAQGFTGGDLVRFVPQLKRGNVHHMAREGRR